MNDRPRDYHDLDDEQQYAYARHILGTCARFAAGGTIKEDRDDAKVHYSGTYLQRTFRATVDKDTRSHEVLVKVDNSSEVLDILNSIHLDNDKQPAPRDEWSEPDADVIFFLAPGVYLEESPDRLEEVKAAIARYPGLPGLLSPFAMQTNGNISASADRIELGFTSNFDQVPDYAGLVQGCLDLAAQLFRGFGL